MNIVSLIKRYGLIGIIENLVFKSLRIIGYDEFQIMRLLRFDLKGANKPMTKNPLIQRINWEDFKQCSYNDTSRFNETLMRQLKKRYEEENKRGELCYGVISHETIVAYAWISLYYYPRSMDALPVKSAFIYDDYTHPDFRGKGYHKQLIEYRLYALQKMGYNTAYASVDLFNKASLKGFLKAGFTECSKYRMWRNRNNEVKTSFCISE